MVTLKAQKLVRLPDDIPGAFRRSSWHEMVDPGPTVLLGFQRNSILLYEFPRALLAAKYRDDTYLTTALQ